MERAAKSKRISALDKPLKLGTLADPVLFVVLYEEDTFSLLMTASVQCGKSAFVLGIASTFFAEPKLRLAACTGRGSGDGVRRDGVRAVEAVPARGHGARHEAGRRGCQEQGRGPADEPARHAPDVRRREQGDSYET